VAAAYDYPQQNGDIAQITAGEVTSRYTGVPVQELLARAQPRAGASLLLVRGSDGYAFFVSMDEVRDNGDLLLSPQGGGDDAAYDIVGARTPRPGCEA